MTVEQCSTTPIEIIPNDSGIWTIYRGSMEQLIAAGFADESYFPEGRKRVNYCREPYSEHRQWWSIKKIKGVRFELRKNHEYRPLPKPKDERYSCPALFKDRVVFLANIHADVVMMQLSGEAELLEYGEKTILIDEQSMQDVLCACARLTEAIRAAKVVCRRKEPHLSIVK